MRLGIAFGLILLLLLAVALVADRVMVRLAGQADELAHQRMTAVLHASGLNAGLAEQRAGALLHASAQDDATRAEVNESLLSAASALEGHRKAFGRLVLSDQERALLASFEQAWGKYSKVHEEAVRLSLEGSSGQARELLAGDALQPYAQASQMLHQIVEHSRQAGEDAVEGVARLQRVGRWVLVITTLVALALGAVLAVWIARGVTRPVNQAVRMAQAVAKGDLSYRADSVASNELGDLQRALNTMATNLEGLIRHVRESANEMAGASAEMAQRNSELAERTAQQASFLNETVEAIALVVDTVAENRKGAQRADELAVAVAGGVERGGQSVNEVVATMQSIQRASQKVSEIVGVINGIASQTNILALNATVEAARAGDKGSGFAVVANEVRALAQSSAAAATQIKDLVGDSVSQVKSVAGMAGESGRIIGHSIGQVRDVSELVGAIAAASAKQHDEIDRIRESVLQADRVTQQNSVLVDETANAAQRLRQQSAALVDAIAVFRVRDDQASEPVEALVRA